MKIATSGEMAWIDRATTADYGIPGRVLMERAGLAVVDSILARTAPDTPVAVIAGKGNNGGDGFVVARELARHGRMVKIILLSDPAALRGDALQNFEAARLFGVPVVRTARSFSLGRPAPGLIVDAILGTGLSGPLRGPVLKAVRTVNASGTPIAAIDIPTGVSGDTGEVFGAAVTATWTVTFGLPKRGHFLFPGAGFCGKLLVADIGFPRPLLEAPSIALESTDRDDLTGTLPLRRPDGHKGSFGRVLVVAGSRFMKGAAMITAMSAFRAGAGLVTVAAPACVLEKLPQELMEAMTLPLPESPGGAIDPGACPEILDAARNADAVALGPGLSREPEVEELVEILVRKCPVPMVLDADGINAIEGRPQVLAARRRRNLVLTPHPAELGRLLGRKTVSVQSDRVGALLECVERTGGKTVVLKGPFSLVSGKKGRVFLNMSGNEGLATAGSGDVLTGLLTTLLAQGMSPSVAARLAVWVHGRAAEIASESVPRRSLMARDVIRKLPAVLNELEQ